MEQLKVVLEKSNTGYSAYSDDILGCVAVADNLSDVKQQFSEAVEFHIEGLVEDGDPIPVKLQGEYEFLFKIDTNAFFEWVSGIISQTGLALLTGMNKNLVSQYANGIKKPGPKQLKRIEDALHKFGGELQGISF
jgi:predicted RNase H-like HicB family nuclease